jgi:hypothetical protein
MPCSGLVRQSGGRVAEHEGGPLSWVLRYLLFVAGIAFGTAWLPIIAG